VRLYLLDVRLEPYARPAAVGELVVSSGEQIAAQLRQEQERYDRGEDGAKPALTLLQDYGHSVIPIPDNDEWIRRDVLAILGYEPAANDAASVNGDEPATIRPFALELDEFIAARSDAPPALIGDDEDTLLPARGLLILVAKGGKGKTTLVIDQAFHLASGIEWLGFPVPRPLRILFVENEGPREPFRRKIEKKRECWPHPIDGAIYVHDQDWGQARLNEAEFVNRLNKFRIEHEIDLVIGDPLDTLGMEGVGSPEDTRNMVACLQRAGLFSAVAWELPHHSRKESVRDAVDEASGAWAGKPDTLLVLEKQKGNRARLSFPKVRWSRRGERGAYVLGFHPETESFELVDVESTEERDRSAPIVELLTERPHLTAKEISSSEDGIGANVDRVRDELKAHPDRFAAHTGDEAKALGRHPSATVWELTRPSESPESPDPSGVSSDGGDLVTPPLRESPVSTGVTPLLPIADSDSESPESGGPA
jgi:hypothetical protein